MKKVVSLLTCIALLATGLVGCNNDAKKETGASSDTTVNKRTVNTVSFDMRDVTIPDRAWVRQCQDAFKGLFVSPSLPDNAPGNDGVIKKNAFSFGTSFAKAEFVKWVNNMADSTNCDRFLIRYGIYPASGKPSGIPSSGLAHLKPNRMTCFVWAYNGDKPATYLNRAAGDTSNPYNLGEIHP